MIQYFKTLWSWFKCLLSGSKNKNNQKQEKENSKKQEKQEKQEINITSCSVRYIKENEN